MHIRLAVKEANKARHKQHRIGAVLIRGGKPVATGHNHSHIHAEHSAINRAWKCGTDDAILVVVRIRRDGSLGLAKPCPVCQKQLAEAGIKKVIYSDSDGSLKTMRITPDMATGTVSKKTQLMMWQRERL